MIDFWIERIQQLTNVKTNRCIRIPPFCIDYYDLTFVLEGKMVYYINGVQYILKKNDAIFLPAGTLRERDYDDIQVRYVSYNFHFIKGKEIELPLYMRGVVNEEIKNLLTVLPFPCLQNSHYDHEKSAYILNAILCELLNRSREPAANPYVYSALRYIEAHINDPLSLKELSIATNLSKEYLAYLFKKETGKTVTAHIIERKMRYAQDLILRGEMSLQDIADYLGYTNYNYFSRVYKSFFQYSPKETVAMIHRTD